MSTRIPSDKISPEYKKGDLIEVEGFDSKVEVARNSYSIQRYIYIVDGEKERKINKDKII